MASAQLNEQSFETRTTGSGIGVVPVSAGDHHWLSKGLPAAAAAAAVHAARPASISAIVNKNRAKKKSPSAMLEAISRGLVGVVYLCPSS